MIPRGPSHRRIGLALGLLMILAASCAAAAAPKNIILLIGDGMGIGHVTAARCAGPGPDGSLVIDTMPFTGFVKTHPKGCLVTDSAAAATALATGFKTDNGRIATLPDGAHLRSIREIAQKLGKSTGVVTTDSVTGATPAAFLVHVDNRGQHAGIAARIIGSRTHVLLGGGRGSFLPKSAEGGGRTDNRDLVAEAEKRGYDVVFDADEMARSTSERILGLFGGGKLSATGREPTLQEMTSKAITVLRDNPKGFFLMVEQARTDSGGHANNAGVVTQALLELDEALRVALDFAEQDADTLVLVTADHETGGMAVQNAGKNNPKFTPAWVSGGHTGNMVPIYASGRGAMRFTGTHDNTNIPRICAALWERPIEQRPDN